MPTVEECDHLDEIRQRPRELLANFYGIFHKNVNDINFCVTNGEIVWPFYRGLDLKNKVQEDVE